MTTNELKLEIQKSLDKVSEEVLRDILDFLKQVEARPNVNLKLSKNLSLILNEDKELLEKLAK